MPIVNAQKVTVGGISYPVYHVSYTNGGDGPSSMTIKFVNENGRYSAPQTNTSALTQIKIGSAFIFNGYVVTTEEEEGESGKFLTVTYTDESIILDKIYVGLKGKHGPGFDTVSLGYANIMNQIVLVGSQIDPCQGQSKVFDPCNPCPNPSGNANEVDCVAQKEVEILDVDYSFSELIAALSYHIPIRNAPNSNNFYRNQYTGSAREVLKQWCEEYGLSFYWRNSGLSFIDLSSGITIQDTGVDANCRVLSKTTSYDISGNKTQANIFYFGKAGEYRDYDCGKEGEYPIRVALKPLTLVDIFTKNGVADPWVFQHYIQPSKLEQIAALAYYSKDARNLYAWNNIYEIAGPLEAESYIGKNLSLFGDMKISQVCHKDSSNVESQQIYNFYLTKGSPNSPFSPKEIDSYVARGAYIVLAKMNVGGMEKFLEFEKGVAEHCMGRYWYRYYDRVFDSGIDGSAPDGTLNYYKRGSLIHFDFLNLLPNNLRSLSSFIKELNQAEGRSRDNFFFLERNQAWMPSPSTLDVFASDCEEMAMKEITDVGTPKGSKDKESGEVEDETNNSSTEVTKVFIVFPKNNTTNKFDIGNNKVTRNGIDAENVMPEFNMYGSSGRYGLRADQTRGFEVATKSINFELVFPSQSGFKSDYQGYYIIVRGKTQSSKVGRKIIKTERVLVDGSNSDLGDGVGLDIQYKNVSNEFLENLTSQCQYDNAKIDSYMQSYANGVRGGKVQEKKTITYQLAGVPDFQRFLPEHGLVSFSFSIDNGSSSTLVFSNEFPRSKSEDITKNQLDYFLKNPVNRQYLRSRLGSVPTATPTLPTV